MTAKVLVLAGTAGTGKSSVAAILLRHYTEDYPGLEFLEGDLLHPETNVVKMREGIPLQDNDRWDWLRQISKQSSESAQKNGLCIVTCSSLKEKYRELIRTTSPETSFYFLFLYAEKAAILQRLESREGHFMKANMMESQFRDLELPNCAEESHCKILYVDGKSFEQVEEEVLKDVRELFSS
ncbi:hypothetical protein HG537_0G01580 [Torulaspora globosa]|uniref:Gluconokinase n=1 Tax=Torulaspora globosa TaxID=48254 RepID=A0A7H9HW00_9SACH|nr:hypothetical protein HG537_0G01580 [Torulaspora sp. CBS 2947]